MLKHPAQFPRRPVRAVRTTTVALLTCLLAVGLFATAAAAQTPTYDPDNPFRGMTLTVSGPIEAGETYQFRVVDDFSGGTVHSSTFVSELVADDDGQIDIDTTDLDAGENYFITGPNLAGGSELSERDTFEVREQTLSASFGDDEDTDTADDVADEHTTDPSLETDRAVATYAGTLTVNDEPAPAGTTIEATISGQSRGAVTIDTAGSYGAVDDQGLSVVGTLAESGDTVRFTIIFPDTAGAAAGTAVSAHQTVAWEPNASEHLDLSASTDDLRPADAADASETDESGEPGGGDTDNADPDDVDTETDGVAVQAPGFGVVTALLGLLAATLILRRK